MVEDHDHCVMISICDPGTEAPTFASKYHEVLSVHFHDISKAMPYLMGRWGAPDAYEQEMVVPNAEHAKVIAQFIRKHWDKHIIVHCEAGVSRSAAVCEVLVQLGWDYKQYVSFGRMHANPLLVSLLRKEFEQSCSVCGGKGDMGQDSSGPYVCFDCEGTWKEIKNG